MLMKNSVNIVNFQRFLQGATIGCPYFQLNVIDLC